MDEGDDLRIKIGSYSKFKIYNKRLLKLFWLTILKFNIETQLGELILDRVPSCFTSSYLFPHLALDRITYLQAKKSDTIEAWGAWGQDVLRWGMGQIEIEDPWGQFTNQVFPLVTFLQFEKAEAQRLKLSMREIPLLASPRGHWDGVRHGSAWRTGRLNKGSCGAMSHPSLFEHHLCYLLNSTRTEQNQTNTTMGMGKTGLISFKRLQPSESSVWAHTYHPPRQMRW